MSDRKMILEQKRAQLKELQRKREERTVVPATTVNPDDVLRELNLTEASPSISRAETIAVAPVASSPRRHKKLQLSKLNETSCAPTERISYARETQTIETPQSASVLTYDEDNRHDESDPTDALAELDKMAILNEPDKVEVEEDELQKEMNRIKGNIFTEEERNIIMSSENFKGFFERYSRVMERAVCETDIDILTDYGGGEDAASELDKQQSRRRCLLKPNRDFYDEHWSRRRVVTSLNWSPVFPELLLASYHSNEDAPHEPDGVCLVWNLKYRKDSPEYVLHCQSALMSACVPNFHPSLVVGGTYSGQIVLWDIRTNKRTPIQRTPLNAACHTHPINQMTVIGTQNAHNLISISSDGKMCSWSLEMLSTPSETLELQKQSKSVALTSMDFFSNDVNNFVVGSEDGVAYPGVRHGERQGLGSGYEGHLGPVSGVSCHRVPGPMEFSHLVLTSSFDWTVKLWSSRDAGQRPLHSFEEAGGDYIYDVAWSPVHPGVFASVDGEGQLALWDVTADCEVPVSKVNVTAGAGAGTVGAGGQVSGALNKVAWHSAGASLAVGGDGGRVSVLDVSESLHQPQGGVWGAVAHSLAEMQLASAENVREMA